MRAIRLAWRLTGLAGALATVVASGPANAAPASTPRWRIVTTIGSSSQQVNVGDITVTGSSDAWTTWSCSGCRQGKYPDANLMYHWNGRAWRSVTLPDELRYPTQIEGLQASSANNLWTFTDNGRAAVFNGRHWTVKELSPWIQRPTREGDPHVAAAVFSASNVWVFSTGAIDAPTLAAHYLGGTWHKVFLPVAPASAVGLAPDDIWIYGITKASLSGPTPVWAIAHWNGASWQSITIPLPHGQKPTDVFTFSPVATSARSVWLVQGISGTKPNYHLLHWDGRWSTVSIPHSLGFAGELVSDGTGGFWMISNVQVTASRNRTDFAHYTRGHWYTQVVPTMGKLKQAVASMASIPGTTTLWATGILISRASRDTGDILRLGQ
jgi:hypothetical protein